MNNATIRRARQGEEALLLRMAEGLLEPDYDFADEQIFVAEEESGELLGFVSLSIRLWSNGAESMPVPHVEAWYVDSARRRQGIGRALISEAERWCRDQGFAELCSDAETSNEVSLSAHERLGFAPTVRLQYFRKALRPLAQP